MSLHPGEGKSIAPGGTASGDLTGTYPSPTIAALAVTDAKVAVANKDGTAGTVSMRTLGTGAQQATAGNDARLPTTTQKAILATLSTGGFLDRMSLLAAQYAAGTSIPRYMNAQDLINYGTGCTEADVPGGGALVSVGGYAYSKKSQYFIAQPSTQPFAFGGRGKWPAPVTGQMSMMGLAMASTPNSKNAMFGTYYDGSPGTPWNSRTKLWFSCYNGGTTTTLDGTVVDPNAYVEWFIGWDLTTLSLVINGTLADSKPAASVHLPDVACALYVRTNTSTFILTDIYYAV